MQIKSWQIVALGTIIQSYITYNYRYDSSSGGGDMYGMIIFIILVSLGIIILTGIILTALLYFKKTQRIGASLSIAIGIMEIFFLTTSEFIIGGVLMGGVVGIFIIVAGVYYFKVESKV